MRRSLTSALILGLAVGIGLWCRCRMLSLRCSVMCCLRRLSIRSLWCLVLRLLLGMLRLRWLRCLRHVMRLLLLLVVWVLLRL
ncbi:hypothetical protein CWC39_00915 [Corynebacterium heidelbergense]|uniref:Uncharacterized protein n=1 Tax=Corynebacterium heidelbergense TaxID=2055947 RepID=A0A364VE88_9CORY|nr:hypothetical protein CWC39_00915 [Corynebacterium heidelbergense]